MTNSVARTKVGESPLLKSLIRYTAWRPARIRADGASVKGRGSDSTRNKKHLILTLTLPKIGTSKHLLRDYARREITVRGRFDLVPTQSIFRRVALMAVFEGGMVRGWSRGGALFLIIVCIGRLWSSLPLLKRALKIQARAGHLP